MNKKLLTSSALILSAAAVISACGYGDQAGNNSTNRTNTYQGAGNNQGGNTAGVQNKNTGTLVSAPGISSFLESKLTRSGINGVHVLVLGDTVVLGQSFYGAKDNRHGTGTTGGSVTGINGGTGAGRSGGMGANAANDLTRSGISTGGLGTLGGARGMGTSGPGTIGDGTGMGNLGSSTTARNTGVSDLEQARSVIKGVLGNNVQILTVYNEDAIRAMHRVKTTLQTSPDSNISSEIQSILNHAQSDGGAVGGRSTRGTK